MQPKCGFNSLLEMQKHRGAAEAKRVAERFNSLLEMQRRAIYLIALAKKHRFQFSIGDADGFSRHALGAATGFNSLLEMLGLAEFCMCGFLSFLFVFWLGGV